MPNFKHTWFSIFLKISSTSYDTKDTKVHPQLLKEEFIYPLAFDDLLAEIVYQLAFHISAINPFLNSSKTKNRFSIFVELVKIKYGW